MTTAHEELAGRVALVASTPIEGIDAALEKYAWELFALVELGDLTEEQVRSELVSAVGGRLPAMGCRMVVDRGFARGRGQDPDKPTWPDPAPLPGGKVSAPELDPDLLPDSLRPWICDSAELSCMPLEYVAVPALVGLGVVLGRRIGIAPEVLEPSWVEPCNLWAAIVGPPGSKKSSAIRKGLRHLIPLEDNERQAYEAFRHDYEARRSDIEDKLKSRGKGAATVEEKARLMEERDRIPNGPKRLKTNDSTIEKLTLMIHDNPDGMLIEVDELTSWVKSMERAGHEGDRGFYLQSWDGKGSYQSDRVGRGSVYIPALCLSVIGSIQPGPLNAYVQDACRHGLAEDGLLQRFQLLVWPDAMPPFRKPTREASRRDREIAEGVYLRLYNAAVRDLGAATLSDYAKILGCQFDDDGQAIFDRWQAEHEAHIRSDYVAARPMLQSHLSKYRSLMPKLALVLHLADSKSAPVGPQAALRAVGWVRYLEAHARKLWANESVPEVSSVQALAEKIRTHQIQDQATVRDICRNQWRGLTRREDVDKAIDGLVSVGWVRKAVVQHGGRPSVVVVVNPRVAP